MSDSQRFDEKAVSEILRRAAELERGVGRSGSGGLTRADLERVALESGLDPAAVRAAIAERERGKEPSGGIFGAPMRVLFERSIEAELDEEGVETLLGVAQHELGMYGRWRRNGSNWTWKPKGVARDLQVRVQLRDGRTEIAVEERLGPLAGGIWGGLMGGLGGGAIGLAFAVGLGALGSGVAVPVLMGLGLGASFLFTRFVFGQAARRRREDVLQLADKLETEARSEAEAMVHQEAESENAPVAAPAFRRRRERDDDDDDDDEDRRRRRRRGRSR